MDGRILGSQYVLLNAFIAGGTWLISNSHRGRPPSADYIYNRAEYSLMLNMGFWITVAIWYQLEVFLRGERSWLRGWLSSPGGSGVLAFAMVLHLGPTLLMVGMDIYQVTTGRPYFGWGFAWVWILQAVMFLAAVYTLIARISTFTKPSDSRPHE